MPAIHLEGPTNITFVHVPKNAGISIGRWFLNLIELRNNQNYTVKCWDNHPTIEDLIKTHNVKFSFGIVRNPWDRVVSSYHYFNKMKINLHSRTAKVNDLLFFKLDQKWVDIHDLVIKANLRYFSKNFTFDEFVKSEFPLIVLPQGACTIDTPANADQCNWLYRNLYKVNTIIKYENIQENFKIIQDMFGHYEPLPVENATEHDHYRLHYTDETRKIVAKLYERDIDMFRYSF